jgi:hypothetical protein
MRGCRNPNPGFPGMNSKSAHQISSCPNQPRPRISGFAAGILRVNKHKIVTCSDSTFLYRILSIARNSYSSSLETLYVKFRLVPRMRYHCAGVSMLEESRVGSPRNTKSLVIESHFAVGLLLPDHAREAHTTSCNCKTGTDGIEVSLFEYAAAYQPML